MKHAVALRLRLALIFSRILIDPETEIDFNQ
jgi:hypothetical protein